MAGNSQRRGATRKPGSKKGATVGSGGQRRKGLEGRGPTPKAEDRVYHAAHKRKVADEKRATGRGGPARGTERAGTSRGGASRGGGPKGRGSVQEVVAGRNSVLEALRARIPVEVVYLASRLDADDRTREIVDIVAGRGYDLLEVGKPELDRLTDGAVHQGVAIKVPPYEYADVDDLLDAAEESGRPPLVVALDGVTDPRNLGAVLRSAGAFGAHGVLVPERRAAGVTASAWKVSAGAAARVPVARATNLVRALGELKKAGCFVVGLDAGGTTAIGDLELATEPLVVVAGSEGKGLSRLVREACDVVASIPIGSDTESLNAAVATGISLYEVARLRREA
ncbi:23S rRNA (guanosine2251-2'-O)-methyltransferase [Cellulosimicrobium aquatile]|uniref:23S rRNA (Guanosine(2251)-2'-O)-methyltransferase RlmB n=2 Tax=Cellulosimicrobium TaxID=157920 RepID=A0A4Y8QYS3_9MICO|nr:MULTISPECIES: 23S rRNA (guanosine(2251)-2'-O)-methyltransferase RlmB [Cellulosimicrobium]TGA69937.1 23S rRNA (guanosine(2251)-2'-O)-methyltransferase RlmB [Cellulosimicrobium terreum]KFD43490.1 RNA methyltransferase [Cellulosimicrobium sp. MM]MCM3536143.1 23S rRNA (guanosine(2251)-2'-O)-methyltransferase RlmB [Cellulosimicrobium funkei]MDQ8042864.1 23S rRNA (guanosine(2251)-2'-O)-methyltransferase RlmB [Cellulosimicrobium sp. XJ-DQ-B-000]NMF27378.1 23S rRNA (guanosine(2251)-2'-O)-methyltran